MIDVKGRVNVLKELFGSLKFKQPTDVVLKQARRELESKR